MKKNLKNSEIDAAVAKSFQVANSAHMASVLQDKMLRGVTLSHMASPERDRSNGSAIDRKNSCDQSIKPFDRASLSPPKVLPFRDQSKS